MIRKYSMFSFLLIFSWKVNAGFPSISISEEEDSLMKAVNLPVVQIYDYHNAAEDIEKSSASIEEYLQGNHGIQMLRRGAYASELQLNNMSQERSILTIDGMRIYGACTDKMDPISSYVEISNLSKVQVNQGQFSMENGSGIGGSINFALKKASTSGDFVKAQAMTAYESNNAQKMALAGLSMSKKKWGLDLNASFRDANNYKAGGGQEVLYSPFTKWNVSGSLAYAIKPKTELGISAIYDKATNVGYPGLPMDVSLAEAKIYSAFLKHRNLNTWIKSWEHKVYYNAITHIMDDSPRPIVPIRMDMPGWSNTAGLYSQIETEMSEHVSNFKLSAHSNYSYAEMTMYPEDKNELAMFMLTWPGVRTSVLDFYMEDAWRLNQKITWKNNLGLAYEQNSIEDTFGLESLAIFYPEIENKKKQFLVRLSSAMQYKNRDWTLLTSLSYAERNPSVSEAYGFYLFNSFDGYDHIGNPYLKKEKALSFHMHASYEKEKLRIHFSGNYFTFWDYIAADVVPAYGSMTIGANGVKRYNSIPKAYLLNTAMDVDFQIFSFLEWKNKASYSFGKEKNASYLPFIQPFIFESGLHYYRKDFSTYVSTLMHGSKKNFNPKYGEKPVDAFMIFHAGISYSFLWNKHSFQVKGGVENIFDTYYSSYSDWNRIPQMGRNIFVNILWNI